MDLWEVIDPSTSKDDNATIEDYLKLYASADEHPRINTIVILLVYVPVFLLAFFGNLIVLLVILTDSRMRKSTANYFLVNLAVTDLLGKYSY
ncbi:gastrin/cholecystokinin type B receptor [Biomphalaria glabrata]|nr:gastrin/cholecystokinin type B receptor [Biomphalaria glabrata]